MAENANHINNNGPDDMSLEIIANKAVRTEFREPIEPDSRESYGT